MPPLLKWGFYVEELPTRFCNHFNSSDPGKFPFFFGNHFLNTLACGISLFMTLDVQAALPHSILSQLNPAKYPPKKIHHFISG